VLHNRDLDPRQSEPFHSGPGFASALLLACRVPRTPRPGAGWRFNSRCPLPQSLQLPRRQQPPLGISGRHGSKNHQPNDLREANRGLSSVMQSAWSGFGGRAFRNVGGRLGVAPRTLSADHPQTRAMRMVSGVRCWEGSCGFVGRGLIALDSRPWSW